MELKQPRGMQDYYDLVNDLLAIDTVDPDRTGVGTRRLFSRKMRFDMKEGLHALTLKRTYLVTAIKELMMFIGAKTNNKDYNEQNVTIWDEWAHDGLTFKPKTALTIASVLMLHGKELIKPGFDCDSAVHECITGFFSTDSNMPRPGYLGDKELQAVYQYFDKDRFELATTAFEFKNAARKLLEKDGKIAASIEDEQMLRYILNKGINLTRADVKTFLEKAEPFPIYSVKYNKDRDGDLGPIYGAQWRKWKTQRGGEIDQLQKAIDLLRTNPNSRRNIVTAWNPEFLPDENASHFENVEKGKAVLPACHTFFVFFTRPLSFVERVKKLNPVGFNSTVGANLGEASRFIGVDDYENYFAMGSTSYEKDMFLLALKEASVPEYELSLQMTMRSADLFLGVPFNIVFYQLLAMAVARIVNMDVGELVIEMIDAHLYANHYDEAKLMMSREPKPTPQVVVNPNLKNIDDLCVESFKIVGYDPHPAIKGEVAV